MKFIVEIESDEDWTDGEFRYFMDSGYFEVTSFKRVEE